MDPAEKIGPILQLLDEHYRDAHVTLDFTNPLELLVATILSAQCTDVRVNQVTPAIFSQYPTAAHYAGADLDGPGTAIYTTGFYRQKAKSLKAIGQDLVSKFGGQVPADLDDLVECRGSAARRPTSSWETPSASRASWWTPTSAGSPSAWGSRRQKDPVKIEFDLMSLVPQERWVKFSHQLIAHGRRTCSAKKPNCPHCPLLPYCDSGARVRGQAA